MDIDTIKPGEDFVEALEKTIGASDVVIALVGRQWLSATDENGRRRIDVPEDFLRREVEIALDRNIRIIPILVQGATRRLIGQVDSVSVAEHAGLNCSDEFLNRNYYKQGIQKLRNRKSLALPSTLSLVTGSGIMRAISTVPIIVEKITKKARSLSAARRPGMNRSIWSL